MDLLSASPSTSLSSPAAAAAAAAPSAAAAAAAPSDDVSSTDEGDDDLEFDDNVIDLDDGDDEGLPVDGVEFKAALLQAESEYLWNPEDQQQQGKGKMEDDVSGK